MISRIFFKPWKSRKFYKNAIILKYENVASKTNSNWFTDIVQIAFYPTCLFRENKNVPLFYFLPLSLKLTKPYALVFPITILNIWNYEKQCYYDKLLGTFLEQGMVSCFLRGDLKFLRFFKTIFHCYSPWLLITRIKYK